jgi:tRNA wybutosine-synthesizing protein 4
MGTCWNKGTYTFDIDTRQERTETLQYAQTVDIVPGSAKGEGMGVDLDGASAPQITSIPCVPLQSADEFEAILRRGHPAVFSGLDLGSCVASWSLDYIVEKVGADRKVCSHVFSSSWAQRLT